MEEWGMLCVLCPPSVSICGMNEDMMTEQERTLTDPKAGQEGRGRGVFQGPTTRCATRAPRAAGWGTGQAIP